MADADPPGLTVRVPTMREDIAAGVDNEAGEAGELPSGQIDGQAFRNRTEIERQGTK